MLKNLFSAVLARQKEVKKSAVPPEKGVGGSHECPVCRYTAYPFDAVDFNKSCEEVRGFYLPPAWRMVQYFRCENCRHLFAPEFLFWTREEFAQYIYNEEYRLIDPDSTGQRQDNQFKFIEQLFATYKKEISHLDYGGGSGRLSLALQDAGWHSRSWDPFVSDEPIEGQWDLITAFEVIEHVPNVNVMMRDLQRISKPDSLVFFSTLLSDKAVRPGGDLQWWYAAPRNGHVSLFSTTSLATAFHRYGFHCASLSDEFHIAYQKKPAWSAPLFNLSNQ